MKREPNRPLATLGVRALETLSEVMRTGSATAAAANLGMTQPGVSRTLAQLERTIGFELFYRDRGKLVPTKDGRLLAEEVEFALAGLQRVANLADDIANSAAGELSVVAPPSFAEGVLPAIVASFLQKHPGVRFNLDSRSLETSRMMIATRVVDCGFMKMPIAGDDLHCEPLVSSGSACVLPARHPLAAHEVLTPDLLRAAPLILLGSGRQWRIQVDQAFAGYRLRPTVAIETHTHGSACALAARGVGIAIVNRLLARAYLRDDLVMRSFAPPIVHQYASVTSINLHGSRLVSAFLDEARAELAKIAPDD
ncbi:LysR substrate-binding domain-containing protein [Sphingomonas sp. MMSM20]|uniref:LysR substrate-binding domain-containing protein n=1 Tax=Sphingomonas lycopersici TaxID=2951807 RepID=UPI002237021E|nr:LysR substrate-binding domain-containing protein [Sphingomonas lycopersici]MCW6530153.1 LysR substrate-binding domain-containing protein [Sphingomonas lycopersici]